MPDDTQEDPTAAGSGAPNPKGNEATRETIEQLDDDLAERLDVDPTGGVKG